jgi:hypothetical protein
MKTIEFRWSEMDRLAALLSALEAERIPYALLKGDTCISVTIGKE